MAMVLLKKLAQTYREVFPDFFKSCPNLPPTSYAYSSNAEPFSGVARVWAARGGP